MNCVAEWCAASVGTTSCNVYGRTYSEAQVCEERNGMGGESPVEGAWPIVVSHGKGGKLSVEFHRDS